MDDNNKKSRRGRRRLTAGLRKHQHIDGVVVEEVFPLFDSSSTEKVGDGIYVSATTAGNKRYYGVMVDQSSLKEASNLFFQDQSDSLVLNERMKTLKSKGNEKQERRIANGGEKSSLSQKESNGTVDSLTEAGRNDEKPISSPVLKKARLSSDDDFTATKQDPRDSTVALETANGNSVMSLSKAPYIAEERPVQKFKYVEEDLVGGKGGRSRKGKGASASTDKNDIGNNYRVLVATFSSVYEAACGNHNKAKDIYEACEEGGNFLLTSPDPYYYQYEVLPPSLTMDAESASKLSMIRTSMSFHSFLHGTVLPPWYPLSNLSSHSKVLNMLSMDNGKDAGSKTNKKIMDYTGSSDIATISGGTRLPMQARAKKHYRIGVIGGGIAGLACCQELVTALNNDGIDAKVTLVEARSRLGGRIATDRSWKTQKNNVFPVELGASWIHGIDDNPLASLAQSAGIKFVKTSEEVKMIDVDMKEVDGKMDDKMGKLFDDLLDHATEDCWTSNTENSQDPQTAVRWYASCFSKDDATKKKTSTGQPTDYSTSMSVSTPAHRRSNDRSVDCEIGKAIGKHKFREFSKLTTEEHRMLLWNSKNVEYALGSNLDNLSMKYWDVDDRHAFEGDHVMLREGYSAVIDHIFQALKLLGPKKFEYFLDFPVGKVEYGRKSERQTYGRDRFGRERQLVELSDSCSITSEDGKETKYFDFLVSAVPLGVLKESIDRAKDEELTNKLTFVPSLPFCKIDAIKNVGFGLLNKVYILFSEPFWRIPGFFKDKDDCLFGNVTGVNPQHYMFFDVGKRLGSEEDSPAILMSLVSGKEAVALEYLPDDNVIQEVMETLRAMFPDSIVIPDPLSFRITRWGKDRFSRGSYTYLPPGSTDQDFQMLQSPINASGDSLLVEGRAETMRLFFAGEHTTALHPSVTHGAMLSGIRAAQEVVSTIQSKNKIDKDTDKVIPISVFRYWNPTTPLQCSLCHQLGGRTREGPLLAFKRGARQVLVHNNCAEFCPEVEVVDFKWKNVIRAVNRGKTHTCCYCSQNGATIGCSGNNCYRMFHVSCAEDTGWRFDRDGKIFFCDECRPISSGALSKRCDRISVKHYVMKNKGKQAICYLCQMPENEVHGELLAFQQGGQMCCVHLNCVKHTTIVKTLELQQSRMLHEYQNVFDIIKHSKTCSACDKTGASIRCTQRGCNEVFHYHCAITKFGWDFRRKGKKKFQCGCQVKDNAIVASEEKKKVGGLTFQHDLLAQFGGVTKGPKVDIPGNLDISGAATRSPQSQHSPKQAENSSSVFIDDSEGNESSDEDDDSFGMDEDDGQSLEVMDFPLSLDVSGPVHLVTMKRASRTDLWNISFQVTKIDDSIVVIVAPSDSNRKEDTDKNKDAGLLQANDIIVSINGSRIGSGGLKTLRDILFRLKQEVEFVVEVVRHGA